MKIHFVGIGGISMSALAKILKAKGNEITGSDLNETALDGIKTYTGHSVDNVGNPDLVVYTAAVKSDNPELRQARNIGIKCIERSELLGRISMEYPRSIAVSGAHGKTTTCGMLTDLLWELDPTVHMGGNYPRIGGNLRLGNSDLFITEACEYVRSFLTLKPSVGMVLNIAADHLDYYRDIDDIENAFTEFACNIRNDGVLIINGDNPHCRAVAERYGRKTITFGYNLDNDYAADGIHCENGCCSFFVSEKGLRRRAVKLSVRGEHNVSNALAAIAAARHCGLSLDDIADKLLMFTGVDRRFQDIGEINGARVVLDYAHHPEELVSAVNAAHSLSPKKIIAVFQPHTYSRTKMLLEGFVNALSTADDIIVADIYAAREKAIPGVTSQLLSAEISKKGKKALNLHSFEDIYLYLKDNAAAGDIVLILGAGDIDMMARFFKKD